MLKLSVSNIGSENAIHCCCPSRPQAAKVICSAKISSPGANGDPAPAVNQADFSPTDPAVVCVTGDKILRFFRVVDAQFKPLPLNLKMEVQMYTAHCWLADEQVRTCDPLCRSFEAPGAPELLSFMLSYFYEMRHNLLLL